MPDTNVICFITEVHNLHQVLITIVQGATDFPDPSVSTDFGFKRNVYQKHSIQVYYTSILLISYWQVKTRVMVNWDIVEAGK